MAIHWKRSLIVGVSLATLGCSGAGSAGAPTELVERLSSPQATEAFRELDQSKTEDTFAALVAGLSHPNPRVRSQSAKLLSRKQDITAAPALKKLLYDHDRSARVQAARSLAMLSYPEELLTLLQAADTPDQTREALAQALWQAQVEGIEPVLLSWFKDDRQPLARRVLSASILADRSNSEADGRSPELYEAARALAHSPQEDLELRSAALELTASCNPGRAYADLKTIAFSEREPFRIREAAICSLGYLKGDTGLEELSRLAADRSLPLSLRGEAIRSASRRRKEEKAMDIIEASLSDPDPRVRRRGVEALRCTKIPRGRQILQDLARRETDEAVEMELQCVLESTCEPKCPPTNCTPK